MLKQMGWASVNRLVGSKVKVTMISTGIHAAIICRTLRSYLVLQNISKVGGSTARGLHSPLVAGESLTI